MAGIVFPLLGKHPRDSDSLHNLRCRGVEWPRRMRHTALHQNGRREPDMKAWEENRVLRESGTSMVVSPDAIGREGLGDPRGGRGIGRRAANQGVDAKSAALDEDRQKRQPE
ncbi:unnamed protein product [Pleuronectes platessa]|uniref:Uncharacterized protein n=1 Tax=Pleuronectes platessa TaxID=8262 RepID=A0A9N7YMP4_PLEPL|nr:unnamed protein product [Pleuronectes platessa]